MTLKLPSLTSRIDAYLKVAYQFSLPFGKDYADAHEEMIREHYQKMRLNAYSLFK